MKRWITQNPKDIKQVRARRKARKNMLSGVEPLVETDKGKVLNKRKLRKKSRSKRNKRVKKSEGK